MKKLTFTITATLLALAAPSFAQDGLICDAQTMEAVAEMVKSAPESSKEIAVAEYTMAEEKMTAGDADTCAIHLNNAATASAPE